MFFRKKYVSGKIHIKSAVELTNEEIGKIVDIVNKIMNQGFYEPCYHISREIFYAIEPSKESRLSVETKYSRFGRIKIKISTK